MAASDTPLVRKAYSLSSEHPANSTSLKLFCRTRAAHATARRYRLGVGRIVPSWPLVRLPRGCNLSAGPCATYQLVRGSDSHTGDRCRVCDIPAPEAQAPRLHATPLQTKAPSVTQQLVLELSRLMTVLPDSYTLSGLFFPKPRARSLATLSSSPYQRIRYSYGWSVTPTSFMSCSFSA